MAEVEHVRRIGAECSVQAGGSGMFKDQNTVATSHQDVEIVISCHCYGTATLLRAQQNAYDHRRLVNEVRARHAGAQQSGWVYGVVRSRCMQEVHSSVEQASTLSEHRRRTHDGLKTHARV